MRRPVLILFLSGILLQACSDNENPNTGKPIVLGDPSTIVTETDTQYLKDFVPDIKMASPPAQEAVSPATPVADTAAKQAQAEKEAIPQQQEKKEQEPQPKTAPPPAGKGLNIEFKEVTVLIPNIVTKSYKQQDTKKANGASYELVSGSLNGNHIKTGGGIVNKVSQRYQTVIAIKNNLGTLYLESLNRTTDWQALKGRNNDFIIAGLDERNLQYLKTTPASLRNAVSRAARTRRMSKATEQKWLNSIKNVRSANQKPMAVVLRSIMWKIEGKDASGRPYQKQIRLDLPLK